jgi:uncharacterized DUF497 family protein
VRISGFMWLEQYEEKLAWKHGAKIEEVEALFALAPRFRFVEKGHVVGENMYAALGQTDEGRYLIVFFIHKLDGRALIISARDMDDSEKRLYGRK